MNRLQHLKIINYFNLNIPQFNNEVNNTDFIISKIMGKFLSNYASEIRQGYTFIINYDNDIFSLMAYSIIKNCISISKINLNIRYLGNLKTEKEKNFFKGIKPIDFKKASKLKKAVLITGFNPISNVINLNFYSKHFINIFNPIENFTPKNLKMIQKFYFDGESYKDFYIDNLGNRTEEESFWSEYFSYPITEIKQFYNFDLDKFYKDKVEKKYTPIVIFSLSGTEKDFPLYDLILKSSKEGNIHLYIINGNDENTIFAKTNLNFYIDTKNMIQDINIINKDECDCLLKKIDNKKYFYYNIENYKGGEEDGDNCDS